MVSDAGDDVRAAEKRAGARAMERGGMMNVLVCAMYVYDCVPGLKVCCKRATMDRMIVTDDTSKNSCPDFMSFFL
jgi:hypothetical protein